MKRAGILILVLLFGACARVSALPEKKVLPPKKIDHDGLPLKYNAAWQDQEAYIETNLDDDPDNEILIGFIATHKPKKEARDKENSSYHIQEQSPKEEIPLIQNYAFIQVYDKKASGYFECVKTFSGMDRPARAEIIKLDKNSAPAIFIFSPGGERYMDLSVYRWENGGFRLLFNIGSPAGIELEAKEGKVRVLAGKEGAFVWNPSEKSFLKEDGEKGLARP